MMKNTQKKLKSKHFRYLTKMYVKNPDRFLKEVVHAWGLNWSENFNFYINSSVYPPMRIKLKFDYGFTHMHLGQMIEAGFVIMKQCNLSPTTKEELFQYSSDSFFNGEIEDNKIYPEKVLGNFFGFKTLKEWHHVLEKLLLSRDINSTNIDDAYFGLDYIPIRELLVKLPTALQEIYNRGGLKHCIQGEPLA